MMTKLNASTNATWQLCRTRGYWRLIYDPEFTSAKNRAKQGLNILDQAEPHTYRFVDDPEQQDFHITDEHDAWLCVASLLREWQEPDLDFAMTSTWKDNTLLEEMRRRRLDGP